MPLWFYDYKNMKNISNTDNIFYENLIKEIELLHPSETSWIQCDFDEIINNSFNFETLYKYLDNIIYDVDRFLEIEMEMENKKK